MNVEIDPTKSPAAALPPAAPAGDVTANVYDSPQADPDSFGGYRSMSTAAMVSLGLGLLSFVSLIELTLGIIPLIGIVLGVRAWRTINRNSTELTGAHFARLGVALSALFLFGGWILHAVVYFTEVPEGFIRISYAQLQPVEGSDEEIPPAARELDGKPVFIKGFIYPGPRDEGIKTFVLCRDNGTCCFGGPKPKLSDMIQVTMVNNLRIKKYSPRLFKLAGTFRIQPQKGEGDVGTVLYVMDAEYVK